MQIVVVSGAVQKAQGGGTLGRFGEGPRLACHRFVRVGRRRICLSRNYGNAQ
jgi:hypothetical protein